MAALGKFLLKQDLNAALVAFGCIMLSFVGLPGEMLAAIVISFITLQKGIKSGAFALAFAALPAVAFLVHKELSVFDLMFLQCLFVVLLSAALRHYHSWRIVFEVMVLLSLVTIGVFHLIVSDSSVFWSTHLTHFFSRFTADLKGQVDMTRISAGVSAIAPYLTGLLFFSASALMFLEMLLARLWGYRMLEQKGRLSLEFSGIRVGYLNAGILFLMLIGLVFHNGFARDVLFCVLLPFVISGLSYLHYAAKRYRQLFILLTILYIGLVLSAFNVKILLALSLIGFIDSLCDFRKRFAF